MKNNKGITLVSLVVTIIVLIILVGVSINLTLGENGIITKAKEAKRAQEIAEIKEKLSLEISAAETDAIIRNESLEQQQLEDIVSKYGTLQEDKDTIITKKNNYEISLKEIWYGVLSQSGSYTDKVKQIEILEKELEETKAKYEELEQINDGNSQILEDLRSQIATLENEKSVLEESLAEEKEKTKQQEELNATLSQTTATEDKILKDYKAYSNGKLITGTMADNGAVTKSLNAGQSYTIAAGYHNGSGKVTANSLASQTQATAIADNITTGKTAWVNGIQITGNGKDINSSNQQVCDKVYTALKDNEIIPTSSSLDDILTAISTIKNGSGSGVVTVSGTASAVIYMNTARAYCQTSSSFTITITINDGNMTYKTSGGNATTSSWANISDLYGSILCTKITGVSITNVTYSES